MPGDHHAMRLKAENRASGLVEIEDEKECIAFQPDFYLIVLN